MGDLNSITAKNGGIPDATPGCTELDWQGANLRSVRIENRDNLHCMDKDIA